MMDTVREFERQADTSCAPERMSLLKSEMELADHWCVGTLTVNETGLKIGCFT